MRPLAGLALAFVFSSGAMAAEPTPLDYGRAEHWVCRPDKPGACASDLTTTVLSADGETIIPALTAPQPVWTDPRVPIETPFVALPGLFEAQCRDDEHGVWLAVTRIRTPGDRRTGDLTGDWMVDGKPEDTMGLHLIDLNLTAGNLLEVLAKQIAAYLGG